ncbi:MAG TPA: hypothetical protein VHD88_04915 [Pyrinomonadaceae bacterium]|nr:hypothetical protein [Pyrinomonadaceae bacterium]
MEPKRSKYDTNPLDEKVAGRAEQSWGSDRPGAPTEEVAGGPTRDVGRTANEAARVHPEREAATRRIDEKSVTSYPSVFIPPTNQRSATYQPPRVSPQDIYLPPPVPPPNVYQPPPLPVTQRPPSHNIAGLGIPERWANLLPYFPAHIGAVAAVIELLLVPRTETRARFHAAQGLALQIAILILTGVFGFVTLISGSSLGSGLFRGASAIFLIVSMVRAWKGKPHHIAPLDEATKWLDDKIKPRK